MIIINPGCILHFHTMISSEACIPASSKATAFMVYLEHRSGAQWYSYGSSWKVVLDLLFIYKSTLSIPASDEALTVISIDP